MTRHSLMAACALGALTLASGALAQSAAPARAPAPRPAPSAAEATSVGEIVVTAEKREANLQDVPEQVVAFTAQDRNLKGIETVQDMTNFTPGFTYSSQLDRPAMRGLARSTNIYLADSSVAVYYDDFFSNSTFLVGRDDMLIDQVEILLGPQGTLYGRNSIGGLINTISKRPTDTLTGEARAEVGNYGYYKFEGTIAGPIMPHLGFRLSAYYENQDRGWLTNVVPGQPGEGGVRHDPYADFQLEYKNDRDDVWFDTYVVGFNNDRGGPGSLLGVPTAGSYSTDIMGFGTLTFNPNYPYGPGNAVPGSVVGQVGTDNPIVNTGNVRTFAHAFPTSITVDKAYTFTLHWTHHFDGFDAKYVGGYSQYHYELRDPFFGNSDGPITSYQIPTQTGLQNFLGGGPGFGCDNIGAGFSPALGLGTAANACNPLTVNPQNAFYFITDTKWSSHEITLSSTWNKPIQWIAGLYYYWEMDNNPEYGQNFQQTQLANPRDVNSLGPAAANPGQYEFVLDYQDRIQSAAAYTQVDWKILPTLKLTGGLRYTFDWKHGQEETRYVYFGENPYVGLPSAAPYLINGVPLNSIFTPQTLGANLPSFDITTSLISFTPGPGICSLPKLATSGPYAGDYTRCLSTHSQALTGTAGIEWTPTDQMLVYARYNRGYKAAAFYAGYINGTPLAAPEHVDDVEVGFKGSFGRNFTIDADAFYYNYTDDQVPIGVIIGSAQGVSTQVTEFVNIPKAVSEGVELTAYWRPIRHLDLSLTYGLDHTSIRSTCVADSSGNAVGACYEDAVDPFATAANARPVGNGALQTGVFSTINGVVTNTPRNAYVQSVNGNELPQAPENKIAFNANYTFEFDPGNLILSATYIWKDKSFSSVFNRTYDEAPSWSQVDLRATWSGHHDRYEVVFFVRNLFNTIGYDAAGGGFLRQNPVSDIPASSTQVPAFDLTPPRTYGMEVHYKF
ncbi:MAG TPA: TonB-dependent receptor [Caulobacteraceae bacterium]|jgi:iron complex outermembrane receptor protein|nr:TonB-dependent receptor [Caulobacteraceae bacterium]